MRSIGATVQSRTVCVTSLIPLLEEVIHKRGRGVYGDGTFFSAKIGADEKSKGPRLLRREGVITLL